MLTSGAYEARIGRDAAALRERDVAATVAGERRILGRRPDRSGASEHVVRSSAPRLGEVSRRD